MEDLASVKPGEESEEPDRLISSLTRQEAPAAEDPRESSSLGSSRESLTTGSDLQSFFPVRRKHGFSSAGGHEQISKTKKPKAKHVKNY